MAVTRIERSEYVSYSEQQMYDLVNDIESYNDFIPGCSRSTVISSSDNEIVASLEVRKGPLIQEFTTSNKLTPCNKIEMNLVKGPFKSLHGTWEFTQLDESRCKVSLQLDFELNGMLKLAFGGVFSQIAGMMVDSFCQRARRVYGER